MFRRYSWIVIVLIFAPSGCAQEKEYKIEGDKCTFSKGCTKQFKVFITDVRKVSREGVNSDKDGKAIREYTAHGMNLIKFKNDEKFYAPIYHSTAVEPGTGLTHDKISDLYTNIYMEQCKRYLPTHADIEKYVYVLHPMEEPELGWRVVEITADPKSDVLEFGDLAKAIPLDDHPQRKMIVGYFKQIKWLPDTLKSPD